MQHSDRFQRAVDAAARARLLRRLLCMSLLVSLLSAAAGCGGDPPTVEVPADPVPMPGPPQLNDSIDENGQDGGIGSVTG